MGRLKVLKLDRDLLHFFEVTFVADIEVRYFMLHLGIQCAGEIFAFSPHVAT